MSKNYAIIIHFMLPLTTFYRSGAHRSDVYKWDAFVTSWRFYNRAWQPQRHDRLTETYWTLWIHRGDLTNQRCSLATGCGIIYTSDNKRHVYSKTDVRVVYGALAGDSEWAVRLIKCNNHRNIHNGKTCPGAGRRDDPCLTTWAHLTSMV